MQTFTETAESLDSTTQFNGDPVTSEPIANVAVSTQQVIKSIDDTGFKRPLFSASFFPVGKQSHRRQADGRMVTFEVIEERLEFSDVYSKLDGYVSTWYSLQKKWVAISQA